MKLDFHKTYDSIRWDFVDQVLAKMGFGYTWRSWIHGCITSAKMSILINGFPSKPFRMERGLRQGDPLSPFLFVLVAKILNKLLFKALNLGFIESIKGGREGLDLSHLQFADDTILFCLAKTEVLLNYRRILACFGVKFGLKINYEKSVLIPIHCEDS